MNKNTDGLAAANAARTLVISPATIKSYQAGDTSVADMAKALGCTQSGIRKALHRAGVFRRKVGGRGGLSVLARQASTLLTQDEFENLASKARERQESVAATIRLALSLAGFI